MMRCQEQVESAFARIAGARATFLVHAAGVAEAVAALAGAAGQAPSVVAPGTERCALVASLGGKGLRVPSVRAMGARARTEGRLLMVDNSLATPFGCLPLKQGAHLSLERLAWAGASNVVAVSCAHARARKHASPLPDEGFSAIEAVARSLRAGLPLGSDELASIETALEGLEGDMQARFDHAHALARYLACHPGILAVRYPALDGHPDRDRAASTLMHGYGPVFDVTVDAACAVRLRERFRAVGPWRRETALLDARVDGDGRETLRFVAGKLDAQDAIRDFEDALAYEGDAWER